jgi:hypothetical protein
LAGMPWRLVFSTDLSPTRELVGPSAVYVCRRLAISSQSCFQRLSLVASASLYV